MAVTSTPLALVRRKASTARPSGIVPYGVLVTPGPMTGCAASGAWPHAPLTMTMMASGSGNSRACPGMSVSLLRVLSTGRELIPSSLHFHFLFDVIEHSPVNPVNERIADDLPVHLRRHLDLVPC